jgi:hypothetical protein
MGLAVVRTDQTYQQGIERMWSRKGRYDYYWPVLANIGEQAILNKEIYAQGNAKDNEAFGYQEAWADYRYKPSKVTGLFRSNAQQSLDAWHYAQDYDALPTLSTAWMEQGEAEMKRTLAQLIYLPPLIYLFIGLRFGTLPLFALWSAPLSASTVLLPAFLPLLLFWLSHPVKSGKSV